MNGRDSLGGGDGRSTRLSRVDFATLFEQAPIGIVAFDLDLRVTECNASFLRLIGTTRATTIGFDLHDLKDKILMPHFARALAGEVSLYEGHYRSTVSDRDLWVRVHASPFDDADGRRLGGMVFVEDVSERRAEQELMRASEQRLALYVRHTPLAVIGWNTRFEVVEWNESAARMFGYSEEEAVGRHAAGLIVPVSAREHVDGVWRQLLLREGGERSVNANITKDGRSILCHWYNAPIVGADGHVVGVSSMVDDITERTAAENALRHSEARFRLLIERAPDAIGVSRGGNWVYVNPALVSYLGYDGPEELIGTPMLSHIHPDDRPLVESQGGLTSRGHTPAPREYRLVRRDGGGVVSEIVSLEIEYDGEPALISFARDITERKQMQLRLLQADRMVSVGTLAAGVAHEINNPLAYMMANLDVVNKRKLAEIESDVHALEDLGSAMAGSRALAARIVERLAHTREMIEIAWEGAERVRTIVGDLRTFSRGDDAPRGPIDVRRVLDASISMAWNEIRHRARLVRNFNDVAPVDANESRLAQVFVNLLLNAAQALPDGRAADNEVRVATGVDEGGRVVVSVADTGVGIAAENLSRIFDPFFTTKPVGVGTGLGLWICQGIVTALGGEISVASELGEGTTFTVSIPARISTRRGLPAGESRPSSRALRVRGRILVIDDDERVGRSLSKALSDEHDVVVTLSAREALARLHDDPDFDVILCDLMMPDVTGMELWGRFESELPSVLDRVVFVTGGAFTPHARAFIDSMTVPLLEKPFDFDELRAIVGRRVDARAANPEGAVIGPGSSVEG